MQKAPPKHLTSYNSISEVFARLQQALDDAVTVLREVQPSNASDVPLAQMPDTWSDGLTPTVRDVLMIIHRDWPKGKPMGRRMMLWYDDIQRACAESKITASESSIRKAARVLKNWNGSVPIYNKTYQQISD